MWKINHVLHTRSKNKFYFIFFKSKTKINTTKKYIKSKTTSKCGLLGEHKCSGNRLSLLLYTPIICRDIRWIVSNEQENVSPFLLSNSLLSMGWEKKNSTKWITSNQFIRLRSSSGEQTRLMLREQTSQDIVTSWDYTTGSLKFSIR